MEHVRALCLLFLLLAGPARSQAPSDTTGAYHVYTAEGTPASLGAIVRAADTANVVLVGEAHNDPTAHALQLHLLQQAHERLHAPSDTVQQARPVALSLETSGKRNGSLSTARLKAIPMKRCRAA